MEAPVAELRDWNSVFFITHRIILCRRMQGSGSSAIDAIGGYMMAHEHSSKLRVQPVDVAALAHLRLCITPQQRNTHGRFTFGRCRRIVDVKPARR